MISSKFECEADLNHDSISTIFDDSSESSSVSGSENYQIDNNGATGKVNKLRSIKLVKLPSVRLRPNYMKTTTSSTAKDTFQKPVTTLTRRSSFKPPRSLTRLPSTKFRRPSIRKSSGGSDMKKKMNKSKSIRLRNRSSVVSSHDAENAQFKASPHDHLPSKSSLSNKSVITRTSSMRPVRMLKKMSSLRANRSYMKKSSQMLDRNIRRATCSSTLKDSKFPNHLELQSGGSESQGISTIKVCPYTYCSLHGHSHSTLPPLKRFVSMRRRVLRTQPGRKLESSLRPKRSTNVKKGIQGRKLSGYNDAAIRETASTSKVLSSTRKMAGPRPDLNREDTCARDGEGTSCSGSVNEDMLDELSDPIYMQGDLQLSEFPTGESHVITGKMEDTCARDGEGASCLESVSEDVFGELSAPLVSMQDLQLSEFPTGESHAVTGKMEDSCTRNGEGASALVSVSKDVLGGLSAPLVYMQDDLQLSEFPTTESNATTGKMEYTCARDCENISCPESVSEDVLGELSAPLVYMQDDLQFSEVPTAESNAITGKMEDTCARDGETTSCSEGISKDVLGELSAPLVYMQDDLQLSEFPTAECNPIAGKMEDGSVESNSPKFVLNATETDVINSSHEEISVPEEVHHEVNEDKSSSSNQSVCERDIELITWEENASEGVVSRTINNTVSSVPICEQLEEESAACEEKNGDYFTKRGSESDYNTHVVDKSEMEKQKHMGLWHLIYKHMASEISAEDEVQAPATETDKDEREDADTCPGTHKSGSSDFSVMSHGLDIDDNRENGSHIQLYQQNAIKLVKEAFDKILSEIPDQSPDDQSSDTGSTQNKEFAENYHDGEELSIPISFNPRKKGLEDEPEKTMLNTDITNGEKTQSEMGCKSKQETPSNWSYLKKIIIRNRFVKALDKAKKFNPRKPRFLPIPSDPEAEKIHLRHQSWEKKKNSEEWMLDYALQQVIATLAPSQKRKVALLVQAFESVGPLPNNGTSLASNFDASSHPTQDEICTDLSYQKSSGKGEETNFGISLLKTSLPNKRSDGNLHCINGSFTEEEEDPDCFSMLQEQNVESSCSSAALSPEITAAGLKEKFGAINLDNNHKNSVVKDDQPDSIKGYLVKDAPKLADVANPNPSNDVLANGEVSESEVHDFDLGSNNQHDVADTSNYVLADGEVSASEVHDLDLGFSDQHDIANIANDVLANREVSASEVHELDLWFKDQHAVANTSHGDLANGEISESDVHDQQDLANTSNDGLANGEVSASEECAACEEKNGDYFPKTDSESDYNTRVEDKSETEKQKHMGLWHLIHKHMVSGITAEEKVQAPATETDKDEGEPADTCHGTHKSGSSDFSGTDHGLDVDDNHENGSSIQLYQQNAIKLVKEAFDKILSEIPDQSNDSGSTQNKEFSKKNWDGDELRIPSSFNSSKEGPAEEPEKTMLNTDITKGVEAVKTQSEMGSNSKQETPSNWSYLKKIIIRNRFVKALDKAKKFNPRKPRFLPIPSDPEAEKIHLHHQSWEEKKKSEEWMLDYALRQVISTLSPSQKRKVALLVQAFESVSPLPNNGTSPSSNLEASLHPCQDESCIGLSYQKSSGKGEQTNFGISLRKTSLPNKRSDENLHRINDSFTEEEEDQDSFSMLQELNLESSCASAALSPEITAASLKENFGVINLDNNDHNSVVKDDQPDSINGYLVKDAPKLADVANPLNDVLANGKVSESEVRGLDLGFNNHRDVVDTSNYVLADGQSSTSEGHDLDLEFNAQHDIANTANDVLANREVSTSEDHELDLVSNDQNDSHNVLANGEISESEFHDQHDVANTSNDVLSDGEVSASEVHDLDLWFNDQRDVANTSSDVPVNGEVSACEVLDLDLGINKQQLPSNYQINERGEQSDDLQNQILQTLEDSSANGDENSLVSVPELVEKTSEFTKGETVLRNKLLQLITPHEESKASSTELTHEKQKNMGLWHLIYKHMVSGTTTLVDEAEQGSHGIVSHGMNNAEAAHHVAGNEKVDFQQIEAIRMVEEAIDEIPLFDSQEDSPDDHPITREASQSTAPDPKGSCLNFADTTGEGREKSEFGMANKSKQKTQKSWSNLKKMILLRRFVKALEKVKEFNPREPRLLELESEKEAEKVLLRRQDMENRKNADEWMLDNALQQVVAKLTPARKRKVQLLVEAFETVVP